MAQDTYLLKADSADMRRWKQHARDRQVSFAQHVRDALDLIAIPGGESPPPRTQEAITAVLAHRATGLSDKRSFKPDFKRGQK